MSAATPQPQQQPPQSSHQQLLLQPASAAAARSPVGVALAPGNPNAELAADGILPLFLTSMTQDLFKVKVNEDVTAEKPIKIIPKADLLSDIQTRLAISDFQPAKAQILEYPGEELLLHYDAEYKYGQNFFLCISVATADAILNPPIVESQSEDQTTVKSKKPESKPWESLGSDKEIEAERVINARDLIYLKVSQRRREFGSSYRFSDRDAVEACLELRSFKDPAYDLMRSELPVAVQAVPTLTEHAAQTNWFRPVNFTCQYEPMEIPREEQETILASEEMADFVGTVLGRFEKALQQNMIMDIFVDDYQTLGEEDVTLEQGSHTYLQLILEAPDDINCFLFNPADPNIIAGGCINGQLIIWDISEYQDKLKSNRKPKSSEDRLGNSGLGGSGGGSSGLDGPAGADSDGGAELPGGKHGDSNIPVLKYIAASSIEFSHRMAITDIQWLPRSLEVGHAGEIIENGDNGNRQLATSSLDGQACFWDMRSKKDFKSLDLVWKPLMRVPLSAMDNTFDYGLTKLSIKVPGFDTHGSETNLSAEKSADKTSFFSSKFYSATEEGDLICSDWIQEKSNEEKASRVEHAFSCHFGPISDLQRSPFFPDILLSVGGWSFHIWKEKVVTGPLLSSSPSQSYLICGRWSPTRPGVFFISKANGTIEVWDLLDRSYQASTVQNVSSIGVSYMAIHQYPGKAGYQFIAAGDDEGTLHILELPRNLAKPNKNEKTFVRTFFDREVRRINYVAERKQFRVRERAKWEQAILETAAAQKANGQGSAAKKEDGAEGGTAVASTPAVATSSDAIEQEYMKLERSFLELTDDSLQ